MSAEGFDNLITQNVSVDNGARSSSTGAMQSLSRGLRVIEAIAKHQPVGVADLARGLGLPKSTVQRILGALGEAGWIEHGSDLQTRWSLTARVSDLAYNAGWESDLRRAARPHMRQLEEATKETVHLSIPDGLTSVVLLERVDSSQPVRTYLTAGAALPLHACSSGKALLATWPKEKADRALKEPLEQPTPRSIVDPEAILAELDDVRRLGYAINFGESRIGVASIGAAISRAHGEGVASIAISMPESRFDPRLVEQWGHLVVRAARAIEHSWRSAP